MGADRPARGAGCARRAGWALAVAIALGLVLPALAASAGRAEPQALIGEYIAAWKAFYPDRAFAYGDAASAAAFADYSPPRVSQWLQANEHAARGAQALLSAGDLPPATRTDLRVLAMRSRDELATWAEDRPLRQQPQWYAEQVSQALTYLLVRDQLSERARSTALVARLRGVVRLCEQGLEALVDGNALRTERALDVLAAARDFFAGGLRELVAAWPQTRAGDSPIAAIDAAVAAIAALETHLREEILPRAAPSPSIGAAHYAAKLARRTGRLYTPRRLLAEAGEEMGVVRALMVAEAARWWEREERGPAPGDLPLLELAIEAMERARDDNSADFLATFRELTFAAERFVEERQLATVPQPTTLQVALSPAHFSGAAVGGVYPSGVFDPQADTLFYVPSVPDAAPEAVKEGFYRSFNTHFNTMIMAHEMFPGHYMQYKVAVTASPTVRALFPNGAYVEGWGTYAEELMLDAGWAGNAPLTRLAHLRKRLENATRAYVSVQVHTAGWGEEQVLAFAREEGLLAPQFAINLWHRVVNSPLQITDYYTGSAHFRRLHGEHRGAPDYPGDRAWVDAVLRAGPLPMALLEEELATGVDSR